MRAMGTIGRRGADEQPDLRAIFAAQLGVMRAARDAMQAAVDGARQDSTRGVLSPETEQAIETMQDKMNDLTVQIDKLEDSIAIALRGSRSSTS
jgi:hypothetical protein